MSILEILFLGIGLAMDAATVSLSNGLANPNMKGKKMFLIAFIFGAFQGIMPILGYFTGSLFSSIIGSLAPYVALIFLSFIGGKMIYECFKKKEEEKKELSFKELLIQGIATSIDAFAIGITFMGLYQSGNMKYSIWLSTSLIALVTFLISLFSIWMGKKFNKVFPHQAEFIGGLILIILGIKIFIEGIM